MEQTLIILKPDAVQRGLVGEVTSRFEKAGLKIVACKMVQPDEQHYFHHYETISKIKSRRGEDVYHRNTASMMEGPVVVMVLEGVEVVLLVRKMVGDTEPKLAAPGTIRGDYAHMSIPHANGAGIGLPNLIHASGNQEEAEQEIKHWFEPREIFKYKTVHERFTQKSKN